MFTCEMSGCDDMATWFVRIGTEPDVELLDVCEDCAQDWSQESAKNVRQISVWKWPGLQ